MYLEDAKRDLEEHLEDLYNKLDDDLSSLKGSGKSPEEILGNIESAIKGIKDPIKRNTVYLTAEKDMLESMLDAVKGSIKRFKKSK